MIGMGMSPDLARFVLAAISSRSLRPLLDGAAIVGPMQESLALPTTAKEGSTRTVVSNLSDMAPHRFPAPDLSLVVRTTTPHVIAAVPLEPAPRVFPVQPSLASPFGERQRGVHAKEIKSRIAPVRAQLGAPKPGGREFLATIRHVLPSEDSQRKHLKRREFRFKIRMIIPTDRLGPNVGVSALHFVVDRNRHHGLPSRRLHEARAHRTIPRSMPRKTRTCSGYRAHQ